MRAIASRHPPGIVVMLTGDLFRYADTASDLSALNVPLGSGLTWFKGVLIADGLNRGLAALYEREGLEWAWLMGDDHRFDADVLTRLLDRDVDCIVPMCLHRLPPFRSTVADVSKPDDKRFRTAPDFPTGGLYRLRDGETCGDAGMLIRKRVLDAIERPWYDSLRSGAFVSDDMAFTARVRKAGFDIHVDCDVRLGHITPMSVTPVVVGDEWKVQIKSGDHMVCLLNPRAS